MNELPLAGYTLSGPVSARLVLNGREYLNFYGAGYLALSGVSNIRAAVERHLALGVPISRQIPAALGVSDPSFDEFESAAARACGTETSVYLPSGYLIGMAGLASLKSSFDVCVLDEQAHYCLKDAVKLTGAPIFSFLHCDADSLADVLKRNVNAGQRPLVVTDGVFATSGRLAPLQDYAAMLASYDGRLFIDESHAFGVVGEQGRGAGEHCDVEAISYAGATLSKAYCAQGAVLACSHAQRRRLLEGSRHTRCVRRIAALCSRRDG